MSAKRNHQTAQFGFEKTSPEEKTQRVQEVFSQSAEKYDLMNDIMSLGMHYSWKKKAVEYAQIQPGDHILDLACGTCDISYYLHQKQPNATIFATDPNEEMLKKGQDQLLDLGIYQKINFSISFAESLPYPRNFFQVVICAFGFRNFTDQKKALENIYRVIKPGGQIIILEFSKPKASLVGKIYEQYAKAIPAVGNLVAKQKNSYQYLIDSIETHMDQNELSELMISTGFESIKVTAILSGLVCIHRGIKC